MTIRAIGVFVPGIAFKNVRFLVTNITFNLIARYAIVYMRELDKWLLCGVSAFF